MLRKKKLENSMSPTFAYDNEGAREERNKMKGEEKSQHGSVIKKIALFNRNIVERRSTTTLA